MNAMGHAALGRRVIGGIALGLLLLFLARAAYNELTLLSAQQELLSQFPDDTAQARTVQGASLYDALVAADAALPPDATVLFVTAGTAPRQQEYIAYHRALYQLAPRPLWWANPAAPDGTWESRWWIETPLAAAPLVTLAESKGANFILFYGVQVPQGLTAAQTLTTQSTLVNLGTKTVTHEQNFARAFSPPEGILRGLGSILVCVAVGVGVLALAARGGYRAFPLQALALAWVVGAGLVSVLMFWLNTVGLALDAQLWVITGLGMIVGGAGLGFIKRAGIPLPDSPPPTPSPPFRPLDIGLTVWVALQVTYTAVLAIGRPLMAWDSWVTFGIKARLIFIANQITPSVFRDGSRAVTHLDYPLLLPLLEAWTFRWLGTNSDRFAGIISVLYFGAFTVLAFAGLRQRGLAQTHALAIVAVLSSVLYLNGAAGAVMADVPLMVYALVAALYLLEWLERRQWGALVFAAIAAGLMPWTKREGVVLLAAFVVALIALGWRERKVWLAALAFVGAALVLTGPWWLLMARERVVNTDFAPITLAAYQANWMRLPAILYFAGSQLLRPDWVLLWLFVIACVLLRADKTRWRLLLPLVAVLYLAAMSQAYVFSVYVPYQQHVVSSIDRLMVQVVSLIVLWGAFGFAGTGQSARP